MKLYPKRYIPKILSNYYKKLQKNEINKSKEKYKENIYYTRKNIKQFKSKPSIHVKNAMKIYKINTITPSKKLLKKDKGRIIVQEADQIKLHIPGEKLV